MKIEVENKKHRYYALDIARAIAIVLVVIGHYCEPTMPTGYIAIHKVIYLFHMPLFLFISGFLFYVASNNQFKYNAFLKKKAKRLIIPYITASVVILLLKLATERFIPLDNPVTSHDFIEILYKPSAGYFLWFLWVLWWCMMLIPWFMTTRALWGLAVIALILHYISPYITDLFCLRQLCINLIYFVSGVLIATAKHLYQASIPDKVKYLFIILFVIFSIIFYPLYSNSDISFYTTTVKLLLALLGIGMSLSISDFMDRTIGGKFRKAIMSISFASFFIYQYHTTFEGFAKGVINKINFYSGSYIDLKYTIGIMTVTLCGLLIPYFLDRKILSRSRITRFIFGL